MIAADKLVLHTNFEKEIQGLKNDILHFQKHHAPSTTWNSDHSKLTLLEFDYNGQYLKIIEKCIELEALGVPTERLRLLRDEARISYRDWARENSDLNDFVLVFTSGEDFTDAQLVESKIHKDTIQKAAENGDAAGQFILGVKLANGRGIEKNEREAAQWYRKAAEQRHAKAQFNLGVMLENGQGIAKDEKEAVRWYSEAAVLGNASAQFNLAQMLAAGRGIAQDKKQAAEWYRMAAEQGDTDAQFIIGVILAVGEDTAKNKKEAEKWCRIAAEQGDTDAQRMLEVILVQQEDTAKNKKEATEWCRKAVTERQQ